SEKSGQGSRGRPVNSSWGNSLPEAWTGSLPGGPGRAHRQGAGIRWAGKNNTQGDPMNTHPARANPRHPSLLRALKHLPAWLLLGLAPALAPAAAPAASPACDRECLRGMVTTYLHALLKHDTADLPVSGKLRVTEDSIEKELGKLDLLRSVTRLR